jgi:mono/diheme cytochrome c family protein/glucose/arabinose dehydrogenase
MASIVPAEMVPPAPFLPVEEAVKTFQIAPGFVIEPVAAEPLVEMPVTMKFDGDGRMWVCEMRGYMPDIDGHGEDIPQGRIVILEDTDTDGEVDKRTVFLDELLLPRSIHLYDDGVLWADQERLYFTPRNGDQPAGPPVVVDPDYAKGGNVEHKANTLLRGLDNWLYNAKSDRRYKRVGDEWLIEKTHFRGQWGMSRDDEGRLFYNSNSTLLMADSGYPNVVFGNDGARIKSSFSSRVGSNAVWPIRVNPGVNRAYINEKNGYSSNTISPTTYKLINATGASGLAIYRGDQFPAEMYGFAFVTEPSGNLLKAIRLGEGDGGLIGDHPYGDSEFLASTDERFRPVNAHTAPDGSLYILDMYHGIIQHKTYVTSYLREHLLRQGLDKPSNGHGRIYRIRSTEKPLRPVPRLDGLGAAQLVKHLSHPNGWHRDTAQRLIVERGDTGLRKPLGNLLFDGSRGSTSRVTALWCLEGLGLLERAHVEFAASSGNDQLASAALYAGLSLSPEDRSLIAAKLVEDGPGSSRTALYRARFLAESGDAAALEQLVLLMGEHGGQPLVREAAFAGLKGREAEFLRINNGRFGHKEFIKWLEDAAVRKFKKTAPPKIKGKHLASFQRGEILYQGRAACIGCHGIDGHGLPNLGPPLDGSDWVSGDTGRLVKILLHGLYGPITVSGERYEPPAAMPGLAQNPTVSDADLADIATYVRHAWSNRSSQVSSETISGIRQATEDRNGQIYTEADFRD